MLLYLRSTRSKNIMNRIVIDNSYFQGRQYHANTPILNILGSAGFSPQELQDKHILAGGIPREDFLTLGKIRGVTEVTCYQNSIYVVVGKAYSWDPAETAALKLLKRAFHSNMHGVEIIREN